MMFRRRPLYHTFNTRLASRLLNTIQLRHEEWGRYASSSTVVMKFYTMEFKFELGKHVYLTLNTLPNTSVSFLFQTIILAKITLLFFFHLNDILAKVFLTH